eukprot:746742-Hanusia_phi.AAC.5
MMSWMRSVSGKTARAVHSMFVNGILGSIKAHVATCCDFSHGTLLCMISFILLRSGFPAWERLVAMGYSILAQGGRGKQCCFVGKVLHGFGKMIYTSGSQLSGSSIS